MKKFCSWYFIRAATAGLTGLILANNASAQALAESTYPSGWRIQLTPYVWMAGLDGHIRPFQSAPTAYVDRSFSHILKSLDAAFFLKATARKDRLLFYADLNLVSTSDGATLAQGVPVQAKIRQTALTLLGGQSFPLGTASNLDLLLGARFWDIRASVDVPGFASAQSTTSFADPIVAARWLHNLSPNWSARLYLDVGGFGAGSHLTWQAQASINYQWNKNIYFSAGFRHLAVDYRHHGKRLDFNQGGPMLGMTFRFE